ncbi:phosphoribosylamine--glycine ligase [Rhodomicrobium udaipurense JA643]|uniref:Phosphoribosylamine--glycine ligase n=1 Tax=Rhodomicrobium udaipurense TaxID=1202716 RepID=A0A8I1GG32_9HYPH|nr:phosphoribosylamine--glycine ligase [Rhodomicrobium udaipurense]KAI96101.1 phosphoribosylamine--glycine ligase [Rhodomicrobium udaipurense JA643]MBJ7544184.1 phosphoribosylamine--glycine ligase [Rhodomicrobium udaipurense]
MNVLLIGGGGREHALAWKLTQSPALGTFYCSPGNAGIAQIAAPGPTSPDDFAQVAEFCREAAIDLVVVGPEAPLVAGLADYLRAAGFAVFGPSAAAAQLEASKSFTKAVCDERVIPTAAYGHFVSREEAMAYAREKGAPLVVKADGLAAGKGVTVCETLAEAEAAVASCFDGAFGEGGSSVVIEEKLIGEEASFFAICDGTRAVPFGSGKDHKRAFDGDEGPNTGGMGVISPAPQMTPALADRVMREIVTPTLDAMAARGTPFQGVLYAGLMITADGPKLIEYNVRFGDPECQVLMLRLKSDLLPILYAAAKGDLSGVAPEWSDETAITVVLAAEGYPGDYEKGSVIRGLDAAGALPGVTVFHAGTKRSEDGAVLANGGRVLNVSALGRDATEARARAYAAAAAINWPEGFYRRDIGLR